MFLCRSPGNIARLHRLSHYDDAGGIASENKIDQLENSASHADPTCDFPYWLIPLLLMIRSTAFEGSALIIQITSCPEGACITDGYMYIYMLVLVLAPVLVLDRRRPSSFRRD